MNTRMLLNRITELSLTLETYKQNLYYWDEETKTHVLKDLIIKYMSTLENMEKMIKKLKGFDKNEC